MPEAPRARAGAFPPALLSRHPGAGTATAALVLGLRWANNGLARGDSRRRRSNGSSKACCIKRKRGRLLLLLFLLLCRGEAKSDSTKLVTVGLIVASFSASICSLLAITVDRYLSLYYALTYNSERTVTFTYIMLILLWGASICVGVLPVMGWNCLKDESTCSVIRPLTKNNAAILSVSFLLMFALMLQLYIQICKIVMRHAHQIALQHHFLATSHYVTTRKGVSTLAIILGTFAACWMPFTLYSLIADYTYPSIYTYATLLPATYNSIINPVIYAFRNQEIQKALWLICCGCIPSNISARARSPSDV
ncbi:G-protein coupled receptor 12 [Crotalus tigris]|uniref:G-protein coupled receptor 12 n=1 Tax=Crotalus tigris TaxID=88082 RepID=UPI00192F3C8C|nr:G-protein coupled receptor 12 [Crotalus tigris]